MNEEDLLGKLVENAVLHGTAFLKLRVNGRGDFEWSVVPPSDYHRIDSGDAIQKEPPPHDQAFNPIAP